MWNIRLSTCLYESTHQTSILAHAELKGEKRQADKARQSKAAYIQDLRDDKTVRSPNPRVRPVDVPAFDTMKYSTDTHCTNALADTTDLEPALEAARITEEETRARLEMAKTKLAALDHMWQAKQDREEAAQTINDYEKLHSRAGGPA
ncbi:uncharacterized protein FTOL_12672 [Fusarium torulosum]|uniref:Uncharacterized protein n=1 Tax=Fusarium torulosum TaxID=33205 RepID=A0AAE8MMI1_9HYPO|nr:uncharacterized protein FTOL_12672 [Fusarium torulosum]